MNIPMNLKGALLTRKSSSKQSNDRQKYEANNFIQKYNWVITEEFEEEVSVTTHRWFERPELLKLLDGIREKKYDFLLVSDWDRLARDLSDSDYISDVIRKADIYLAFYSTEQIFKINEEDVTIIDNRTRLPWIEIIKLRSRVMPKMENNITKGKWNGGKNAPYGYSISNGYIIINPSEAIYLKQVFEYSAQGLGPSVIMSKMPLKSYRGKDWSKDSINRVIKNPICAGNYTWKKRKARRNGAWNSQDEWITEKLEHLRIIPDELWDSVHNLRQKRSNREWAPRHTNSPYLLAKLIRCIPCNTIMKPKDATNSYITKDGERKKYGQKYYYCSECGHKLTKDETEREVIKYIKQTLDLEQGGLADTIQEAFSINIKNIEDYIINLQSLVDEDKERINNHKKSLNELPPDLRHVLYERISFLDENLRKNNRLIEQLEKTKNNFLSLQKILGNNIDLLKTTLNKDQEWSPNELRMILDDLLIEVQVTKDDGKIILKERTPFINENVLCF